MNRETPARHHDEGEICGKKIERELKKHQSPQNLSRLIKRTQTHRTQTITRKNQRNYTMLMRNNSQSLGKVYTKAIKYHRSHLSMSPTFRKCHTAVQKRINESIKHFLNIIKVILSEFFITGMSFVSVIPL